MVNHGNQCKSTTNYHTKAIFPVTTFNYRRVQQLSSRATAAHASAATSAPRGVASVASAAAKAAARRQGSGRSPGCGQLWDDATSNMILLVMFSIVWASMGEIGVVSYGIKWASYYLFEGPELAMLKASDARMNTPLQLGCSALLVPMAESCWTRVLWSCLDLKQHLRHSEVFRPLVSKMRTCENG